MRDDGFLLIDTLLALLTFSIIVMVLVPAVISLGQLEQISEMRLSFSREVYLHLMNNNDLMIDDAFFAEGVICRDADKKICVKY